MSNAIAEHPADLQAVLDISGLHPEVVHYLWDEYQAVDEDLGDYPFTVHVAAVVGDAAFTQAAANGGDLAACKDAQDRAFGFLLQSFGVEVPVVDVEAATVPDTDVDTGEGDEGELHG